MNVHIIIPARYQSVRFPGKVLAEVMGKPLVQYVYERALSCGALSVTIATDDERVKKAAENFGAAVCMTDPNHPCGTARLAEAVRLLNFPEDDIVVNIQGDEPHVSLQAVQLAVKAMNEHPAASVTTLCTPIEKTEEVLDPNIVKVILDKKGFALYFSRAPIPYDRNGPDVKKNRYFRHLGLYVYRVNTLKKYAQWESSPFEIVESLEQLRVLWHGEKIHVSMIEEALSPGIDTPADLARFKSGFEQKIYS